MTILSVILVLAGTFFFFSGTLGFLRFPDCYTRMHATGKCDTLGALFCLAGMAVYTGFSLTSLKILLIAAFVFFTSPTATHAILRGAFSCKVEPWSKEPEWLIDAEVRRDGDDLGT